MNHPPTTTIYPQHYNNQQQQQEQSLYYDSKAISGCSSSNLHSKLEYELHDCIVSMLQERIAQLKSISQERYNKAMELHQYWNEDNYYTKRSIKNYHDIIQWGNEFVSETGDDCKEQRRDSSHCVVTP